MGPSIKMQTSNLIKSAFILTFAAIITKILSAIYRIPFQNLVGDIGFYIYQQVYPFYGIALSLATYGFPVIISKIYAEKIASNDLDGAKSVIGTSLVVLFLLNGFVFFILFFGADLIAHFMGDIHLTPMIKIVSFSFLLIPLTSIFRGYYQGHGFMLPTATSQVVEQLVRVTGIIVFAIILLRYHSDLYIVGGGAILASILGSIFAVIVLIAYVWRLSNIKRWRISFQFKFSTSVFKSLITDGIAICISGMLLIMFQLMDAFQLYSILLDNGYTELQAKEMKGIFDRGQPIIQLGTVLATSLSLSLVPFISSAKKNNRSIDLQKYICLSYKTSFTIGAAASLGLILIMDSLNIMLFQNANGSYELRILALSILFTSIILTNTAILQGFGQTTYPAIVIIIGVLLKFVFNEWLINQLDSAGAALSTVLSLIVITVLLVWKVKEITNIKMLSKQFYIVLFTGLIMLAIIVFFYLNIMGSINFSERLLASFQAISSALIGGVVFLIIIIKGKMFSANELQLFPLGNILIRFLPKKERKDGKG